ncbi:hypothetical protein D3C83_64720 [compost metagenome]
MPDAKGVVFTFFAARKWRQSLPLADGGQPFAPPGKNLVHVGLVTHVPNQAILGSIEHVVQRDGQLHRPEARGEVPAALA